MKEIKNNRWDLVERWAILLQADDNAIGPDEEIIRCHKLDFALDRLKVYRRQNVDNAHRYYVTDGEEIYR